MNTEEALREAMAAHVERVRAPAFGPAVRRRRRARLVRFRAAGAAAVTVVVAGAFPAYNALTGTGTVAGPAPLNQPQPDGRLLTDEPPAEDGEPSGQVEPAPAEPVPAKDTPSDGPSPAPAKDTPSDRPSPSPEPSKRPPGDLAEGGRIFGPVKLGFLPPGLKWGGWWGRDGFGRGSLTTSWNRKGDEEGLYRIQIILYQGKSLKQLKGLIKEYRSQGVEPVLIAGTPSYQVRAGEAAGRIDKKNGTPTITWMESGKLGVQLMMSPFYAEELGSKAGSTLTEIARSVYGIKR